MRIPLQGGAASYKLLYKPISTYKPINHKAHIAFQDRNFTVRYQQQKPFRAYWSCTT